MSGDAVNWKFRPHPLIFNGHLQSLAGIYLPCRDGVYQAVQHQLPLEDGDKLVLHEDVPDESKVAGQPNVLLIHGLAGSYLSSYMCRTGNYSAALIIAGRMGDLSKADWIPSRIFRLFLRSVET